MSDDQKSEDIKPKIGGEKKFENVIDDVLLSLEKLDRASPELWPEKIPGVKDFISMNTPSLISSPPNWTNGLTQEDINAMHQLGALSLSGLITEIQKLNDQTYQLGVQEAKEMTRGKYLNIFKSFNNADTSGSN